MKRYEFVHYQSSTKLKDIASYLAMNWQDWTVVSHSSNDNGMTILLVKEES